MKRIVLMLISCLFLSFMMGKAQQTISWDDYVREIWKGIERTPEKVDLLSKLTITPGVDVINKMKNVKF